MLLQVRLEVLSRHFALQQGVQRWITWSDLRHTDTTWWNMIRLWFCSVVLTVRFATTTFGSSVKDNKHENEVGRVFFKIIRHTLLLSVSSYMWWILGRGVVFCPAIPGSAWPHRCWAGSCWETRSDHSEPPPYLRDTKDSIWNQSQRNPRETWAQSLSLFHPSLTPRSSVALFSVPKVKGGMRKLNEASNVCRRVL